MLSLCCYHQKARKSRQNGFCDKTAYVWALDYRWRSFAIDDRRSRGRATYAGLLKVQRNDPSLTLQVPFLPQTFFLWHKGLGRTFRLERVKLNPLKRRFSGVPLSSRTPSPWDLPMIVTPAVWIVEQRWHLITSATPQTVTATGRMLRTKMICTQHSSVTVKTGPKTSRTVSELIIVFPHISEIWKTSEAGGHKSGFFLDL